LSKPVKSLIFKASAIVQIYFKFMGMREGTWFIQGCSFIMEDHVEPVNPIATSIDITTSMDMRLMMNKIKVIRPGTWAATGQ
jgi:hypothetical protein